MSIYKEQALGVGKVNGEEATDYVVPNDQLSQLSNFVPDSTARTIADYLSGFEKKHLRFAIRSPFGDEYKYSDAYVDAGSHVLAVRVNEDNCDHFFVSQYLRNRLRQEGRSVVRRSGSTYAYTQTKIDTTKGPFELPKATRVDFGNDALYQDYWLYNEFVSGYAVNKNAIAQLALDWSWEIIGSFDDGVEAKGYLQSKTQQESLPATLQQLSLRQAYWNWNKEAILAVSRDTSKGQELFLSREGYQFLKDENRAVLRGKKQTQPTGWESLSIQLDPETMKPSTGVLENVSKSGKANEYYLLYHVDPDNSDRAAASFVYLINLLKRVDETICPIDFENARPIYVTINRRGEYFLSKKLERPTEEFRRGSSLGESLFLVRPIDGHSFHLRKLAVPEVKYYWHGNLGLEQALTKIIREGQAYLNELSKDLN